MHARPGITTVVRSNGTASSRTDFIATATGRLGYTFGRLGEGMVYAKGAPLGRTTNINLTAKSSPPLAVR
jgi:hypothetical protein